MHERASTMVINKCEQSDSVVTELTALYALSHQICKEVSIVITLFLSTRKWGLREVRELM